MWEQPVWSLAPERGYSPRMNRSTILVALLFAACGRAQPRDEVAGDSGAVTDTARVTDTAPPRVPDTGGIRRTPPVVNAPKSIDAVLAAHNDALMAVPGVVGTAVGRCRGAPCIRVLVTRTSDELRQRIPRELEGFPVQIDVTGPVVPR